jgi:hypothetical protein
MAEERQDEPQLEAVMALLRQRYGGHIPDDQLDRLREGVRGLREAAAALYAHPLTNVDEPDPTYAAYREEG